MEALGIIFIIINSIAAGVVGTLAVQHAYEHFKKKDPSKPSVEALPKMVPAMKKQLLEEAEAKFRKEIADSTSQLHTDIQKTTAELSTHVTKIGGEIVATEMQRYRDTLEALRRQSEQLIKQAQTTVTQHQTEIGARATDIKAELEKKAAEDIEAQKQQLLTQLDTKLSDAVSSFLLDTLQHNIDLGAQADYMLSVLEENKEEIIREVRG